MNRAARRQQKKLARQAARKKRGQTAAPAPARLAADFHKAVLSYRSGARKDAGDICRRILAAAPDFADASHLLGILVFEGGDGEKARMLISRAIESAPQATFYNSLGNVLKALGKPGEAAAAYKDALAREPGYAEACYNLANLARDAGNLPEAMAGYRKAISLKPGYVEALSNLALVLTRSDMHEEALAACRKALAARPEHVNAIVNMANALKALRRFDEAEKALREAIALRPGFAEAHFALAGLFKSLGRTDEAVAAYQDVLAIEPDNASAYRLWAHTRKHEQYDSRLKAMQDSYEALEPGSGQKMHLAFGLGKAFEDLKRYEEAFACFAEGNRIKHGLAPRQLASEREDFFKAIKDNFTPALFRERVDCGFDDETPVFILGMPRSGTSLVEQVLASHSRVHGAGELATLARLVAASFSGDGGAGFANEIARHSCGFFENLGREYVGSVRGQAGGADFVTDKRPSNFRYIGLIRLALPGARIIHCTRSPQDTCLSIFKSYFPAKTMRFPDDLAALGHYYNHYRELMRHWHETLPGYILDIRYEDMVADQENQTRRLLDFCGLQWEDACLEFYKSDRPVQTASAEQVRQPIYSSSVASWRRYEKNLAPLLEILGDSDRPQPRG